MLSTDNGSNKSSFRKSEENLSATNEESFLKNCDRRILKNFTDISKYDKRVGCVMSLLANCVTLVSDCVLYHTHYNCNNHRYSPTLLWVVRLESCCSLYNDYGILRVSHSQWISYRNFYIFQRKTDYCFNYSSHLWNMLLYLSVHFLYQCYTCGCYSGLGCSCCHMCMWSIFRGNDKERFD
ncbi:unnamed protein product [Trichobilharzia szidati]|nr:unnamed protein product [Trichobilharzia szidati]